VSEPGRGDLFGFGFSHNSSSHAASADVFGSVRELFNPIFVTLLTGPAIASSFFPVAFNNNALYNRYILLTTARYKIHLQKFCQFFNKLLTLSITCGKLLAS
jgi:hypothetical protein